MYGSVRGAPGNRRSYRDSWSLDGAKEMLQLRASVMSPSLLGRLRLPASLIAHPRIQPDPAQGCLTATTLTECTPPMPPTNPMDMS